MFIPFYHIGLGTKLSCQSWQQEPLPTEQQHGPQIYNFKIFTTLIPDTDFPEEYYQMFREKLILIL